MNKPNYRPRCQKRSFIVALFCLREVLPKLAGRKPTNFSIEKYGVKCGEKAHVAALRLRKIEGFPKDKYSNQEETSYCQINTMIL